MIEIILRPRRYTLDELRDLYSKYSTDEADFNEWLTAMQITRQLLRRENEYIPAGITAEKELVKPFTKDFVARLAGGRADLKQPRVGIRTLLSEKTRVDPTDMYLVQYRNTRGQWVDIPERPRLNLVRPRSRTEKWRAEIPAAIRRKYPLKILTDKRKGTELRVLIRGTITNYFSRLKLWGFSAETMVTFGVTRKGGINPRDLELHGYNFHFETKGAIQKESTITKDKSADIMKTWLEKYNIEYNNILQQSANELTTGVAIDPQIERPETKTRIQFLDHDAKTVDEERARVSATLPRDWIGRSPEEMASFFEAVYDRIDGAAGYHGRNISGTYGKLLKRQTTLDELTKGTAGEGFKIKKGHHKKGKY